jgi:hypothetical protein
MPLRSHRREWTFALGDRDHSIEARIESRGLALSLSIWLDGEVQVQEKASDLAELWGEYPLRIEQGSATVRAFRKGVIGLATEFELQVEGQLIAEGEHATIAAPEPELQEVEGPVREPQTESAPAPGGVEPVVAALPAACPSCGASLNMNEVRWVGPLTAQCPYCGRNVAVEWRKIG